MKMDDDVEVRLLLFEGVRVIVGEIILVLTESE
jgi:hypothetical protein